MKIQSRQIEPIPSTTEFDRLMAPTGITAADITTGGAVSYMPNEGCVRLAFATPTSAVANVCACNISYVKYFAVNGVPAAIEDGLPLPVGTSIVDILFQDGSFPVPYAKIPDDAFRGIPLEMVIIPSTVMALGAKAFTDVRTMVMRPLTPPLTKDVYDDTIIRQLVVEDVSLSQYRGYEAYLSVPIVASSKYTDNNA